MTDLYHGTSAAEGMMIGLEGLKPATELPPHHKSSHFTDRQKGHVFFFQEFHPAALFGCSKSRIVGLGPNATVFKTDSEKITVTRDQEQKGPIAWKHKGAVSPELLEELPTVQCDKDKDNRGMTYFDKLDYVANLTKRLKDVV